MSATDTPSYEIWTDPMGRPAYLIPVGTPDLRGDGEDDGWFAEDPGQLPPYEYRIQMVANERYALKEVVFPYAPWNAYDAISDRLVANGWIPPAPTEAELATCEHGLSLSLCAGPGHYPQD